VDTIIYRPVGGLAEIDANIRGVFLNMAEYLTTLYALYFMGVQIAVRNGNMDSSAGKRILKDCEIALLSLGELSARHEPAAVELASELKDLDTIWIIGAGPNQGTARYCAAKFHEQLPRNGIPEDLEEWAHLQYFLTLIWKERSTVFVLVPPGNCLDRAKEVVHGIVTSGGRAVVVAHPGHKDFPDAWRCFDMPGLDDEFLSPLTYHVPAQLLVLHLARQAGQELIPLRRRDDYWLIRRGVIRADPHGLL
jgi:glucosamine--fructose-6-phosphate aminotransferase (isomerizing)